MEKIISLSFIYCLILSVDTKALTESSREKDDRGYKYYPEIGWVHHHPMPLNWVDARLICYYEGAELMSPSDEQMLKVMSELGGRAPIWTGVHATYYKGNFFSISGTSLSEMPITWAQDEPDNENNSEECLLMLPGGKLADCNCNETYAFSCYKPNNFKTIDCGSVSGYEIDHRTKSCYKFHSKPENWNTAFMICAAEGAQLAVIDTPGEQDVLKEIYAKKHSNGFIYLGVRDWTHHGLWMTINGKNINDLPGAWANNEPNSLGGFEYCGSMTNEGTMNDIPCETLLQFLCEFKKK